MKYCNTNEAHLTERVEGAVVAPGRKPEKMVPPGSMSEGIYHTAREAVIIRQCSRRMVSAARCLLESVALEIR